MLPLLALTVVVGANVEAAETRRQIREFIQQLNPEFPYPDKAANQLLYAQSVGGADAKLMAALVAQERRWSLRPNAPYTTENLGQMLHSTARRNYGRSKAPDWQTNLLWCSWYLQGCLSKERWNVTNALRRYNSGPEWSEKPLAVRQHSERYARAVLYYRRQMK
jgi:hypothetical protein